MDRYGLIGADLSHSFSQKYFTQKFAEEGIAAVYENFELAEAAQVQALCRENPGIRGLNVTIPFKRDIMAHLDRIDAEAAEVGAVNTIAFRKEGLVGYNTDVVGFRDSIKPFLAHGMERALILGTGGASLAVAYVLKHIGIEVFFASRNPEGDRQLSYADLNANAMRAFRLIVNTTPLGTWPHVDQKPDLPYAHLGSEHLLYDLVYNPAMTAFLAEGKARGAIAVNGLSMLRIQADHSWRIWQQAV